MVEQATIHTVAKQAIFVQYVVSECERESNGMEAS